MIPKSGYRFSDQITRQNKRRMMAMMIAASADDGGVPRSKKA